MKTLFKKKEQMGVGIDVGAAFIKAAVIDKSKPQPELIGFVYQPVGAGRASDIKKSIAGLDISNIGAVSSISGPSVIVRIVNMPNMTEKELKGAVNFEAEKYIPYKLDEVITDFVKLSDLPDGKINLLLVAAKKSAINARMSLMSEAGVSLRAVDIDSFAIMNSFLKSQKEIEDTAASALINIGAEITNVNIIEGAQSYLARDIQIGGNHITRAIAEKLNVDNSKAEALKINPAEKNDEITPITKSVLCNLLNEIRLSFDFYENHYGKNVHKIYLSGGTSRMKDISALLEDIGVEIVFWDPFNNINMGPKVDKKVLEPVKTSFAVAVGLALREN